MVDPDQSFDPTVLPAADPCPFCAIATTYPPYDPTAPPGPESSLLDPDKAAPASFVVLSTPTLLAFLDILPLSAGHLLLCPRRHAPKLTDVNVSEAAELGRYLRLLSKALVQTTGVNDWNVVQNNGAAAAQVVNHVHYHLIPRPEIRASGKLRESFTMFGRGVRSELDDDEGAALAAKLREAIRVVLDEESRKAKL
ncbi:HIT-like protein [Apiospora marii]|uniref:HIT-like protein n=1 Tax=Apiospora marii TaxID=335849 RepID=A0ABR1R5U4_9PEZI